MKAAKIEGCTNSETAQRRRAMSVAENLTQDLLIQQKA